MYGQGTKAVMYVDYWAAIPLNTRVLTFVLV